MGKDRDTELDDLEKELRRSAERPFIDRPKELDVGPGTLCWLDGFRRCGADCVAFNADEGLDDQGVPIDSPNKCLVLTYMGQQGSAAVAAIAVSRKAAQRRQDERNQSFPMPTVGQPGKKT